MILVVVVVEVGRQNTELINWQKLDLESKTS